MEVPYLCGLEASAMWMCRWSARGFLGSAAKALLISSSAMLALSFSSLPSCERR